MSAAHSLDQGGGIMAEVGSIERPVAARDTIKRIREYIRAMTYAGKRLSRVMVTRQQYSTLYGAATKNRDDAAPPRCGLAGGWCSVTRGGV